MYIAMNRFRIVLGRENEFESIWKIEIHIWRMYRIY